MKTRTIFEYTLRKISGLLTAHQLVVIVDPYAHLNLPQVIQDLRRRKWQVVVYDGNDFAFRQHRPESGRQIIWVVLPEDKRQHIPPQLFVSGLIDVLSKASLIIDASLPGILQELFPDKAWSTPFIWDYADIFEKHLDKIPKAIQFIRYRLSNHTRGDEFVICVLALHCLYPQVEIEDLLFIKLETQAQLLAKYLSLLWRINWDDRGLSLLQILAQTAPEFPIEEILPWLSADPNDLAIYIYFRQMLSRCGTSDPVNQLRRSGIIRSEPGLLESGVHHLIISVWDKDKALQKEVTNRAESLLHPETISQVVSFFDVENLDLSNNVQPHMDRDED